MKTPIKLLIVAIVAVLVVAALALRQKSASSDKATASAPAATAVSPAPSPQALPRLLDLGADKCIPCKMMAPILRELQQEYADVFTTEFVDVWKNPDAGNQYKIRVIPTQIFFDANGKELFRHEGFYGKDDILGKWKELGIAVAK